MKRPALLAAFLVIAVFALCAFAGCGDGKSDRLLESERRLEGMYEACQNIVVSLPDGTKRTITVDEVKGLPEVEVNAVLKRSNGMTKSGTWSGARLSDVLAGHDITGPFKELRVEAWDGYVGRVGAEVAMRPDTILAYMGYGKPLPEEDGPLRLVVASEDGFYWIRMITGIEVIE